MLDMLEYPSIGVIRCISKHMLHILAYPKNTVVASVGILAYSSICYITPHISQHMLEIQTCLATCEVSKHIIAHVRDLGLSWLVLDILAYPSIFRMPLFHVQHIRDIPAYPGKH